MSELTSEETLKRVLQFPDLVRTNDWVQLEMVSGIHTNSYALESMITRCSNAALEYPHLEACGLGSLKATLRSTGPEVPRSPLQPVSLVSNLGTPCPLPFPQIAGPPSLVTGTIHQLDMQLVPVVQQEHSVDTQSAPQRNKPGPRGDRSSAERKTEIRKRNPEQYQKELVVYYESMKRIEVYYESMKRKLKIQKPIYECRCNGRLQTKRFTRLSHTGLVVELEHLKIKTRLTNEKFASVKGECEI